VQYVGGEEGDKRSIFDMYRKGMSDLSGVVGEAREIATKALFEGNGDKTEMLLKELSTPYDFSPEEETGPSGGSQRYATGNNVYNINMSGNGIPDGKAIIIVQGKQPVLVEANAGITDFAARTGTPLPGG
jgi:hypothetical protein